MEMRQGHCFGGVAENPFQPNSELSLRYPLRYSAVLVGNQQTFLVGFPRRPQHYLSGTL
jgi:hypothetical protein